MAMLTAPDQLYRDLVVGLGVDAQTVNRRVDIQSAITTQVDAARESEAGVNMDEEMVALVQYQHAYDAAARYLVVVDEMLATLVGLVGR
jgi:flagellar hook-associated protein 1 FlgK